MSEQIINIRFERKLTRAVSRLRVLAVTLVALALSGCMPEGQQNVNTELFKGREDMQARSAELTPGMPREAVFEALGIKPGRFERMSAQEVQMSIYGNSQVHGTPDQLEQFKRRMLAYEGYALPYREIKSDSSFGFGKVKVNKTGYDLKLVIIFERGMLLRAAVEGTQEVKQEEDDYLWDNLIKKGIGFAF
jgi:hypothetical protein